MMKKTFKVNVNDIEFYCEMRGEGPVIVLVPDGCNDCEPYDSLSKLLCDEFKVLTFDMRGGTRSMDYNPKPITPEILANDVASIVKKLELNPVSLYGCSSGGQTVLSVGKYHPDIVRNIIVHEAALMRETPIKNTGFDFFDNINTFSKYVTDGLNPADVWGVGNAEKALALGSEVRDRINENSEFWSKWYRNSVDLDTYTAEDFKKMPDVSFTVGTWSPAWLVYANIETAVRGNCPLTWINCAHHPEIVCPNEYSEFIRKTVNQYL